jgi:cytochrome c553
MTMRASPATRNDASEFTMSDVVYPLKDEDFADLASFLARLK